MNEGKRESRHGRNDDRDGPNPLVRRGDRRTRPADLFGHRDLSAGAAADIRARVEFRLPRIAVAAVRQLLHELHRRRPGDRRARSHRRDQRAVELVFASRQLGVPRRAGPHQQLPVFVSRLELRPRRPPRRDSGSGGVLSQRRRQDRSGVWAKRRRSRTIAASCSPRSIRRRRRSKTISVGSAGSASTCWRRTAISRCVDGVQKNRLKCNWKLAVDNLYDWYHVKISHGSALRIGYAPEEAMAPMSQMVILGEYGHGIGGPGITQAELDEYAARMKAGGGEPKWYDMMAARRLDPRVQRMLGPVGNRSFGHPNIFPNLWVTQFNQVCLRVPRGPYETELWWFTLMPKDMPEDQRRFAIYMANHTFGPAGLLEQDDGENWSHSTRGAKGAVTAAAAVELRDGSRPRSRPSRSVGTKPHRNGRQRTRPALDVSELAGMDAGRELAGADGAPLTGAVRGRLMSGVRGSRPAAANAAHVRGAGISVSRSEPARRAPPGRMVGALHRRHSLLDADPPHDEREGPRQRVHETRRDRVFRRRQTHARPANTTACRSAAHGRKIRRRARAIR